MLLGFLNRLKRILPLADRVAEDIVCEDAEVLEEVIPRMFEVVQSVAKFSCDYVRRKGFSRSSTFLDLAKLMIAERTKDGIIYSKNKEIEEMDGELTTVIEDFTRAVDVEALRLAKKNGKHISSQNLRHFILSGFV